MSYGDMNAIRAERCARGEHCREHSDGKCCGCETPHGLARFTDDQLRAECERRGRRSDGAMRPEWLATSELLAEVRRRNLGDQLMAERDEWKRRAEAAEAYNANPRKCIRIETPDGLDVVDLGSAHDCGRLELLVTRRDNETLPMRDMLLSGAETGPGIAAKPLTSRDEPLSHLPEDLLCEDA